MSLRCLTGHGRKYQRLDIVLCGLIVPEYLPEMYTPRGILTHLKMRTQVEVPGGWYRLIDPGLVGSADFSIHRIQGYRESRRCARDTCPESYITKYTSIRR